MVNVIFSLVGSNGDEIVFNDSGDFILGEGVAGIGIPATSVGFAESASDGALWRSTKRGIRDVDLPIVVFGGTQALVEANLRRLSNLLQDRNGGTILRASYANGEVWELTDGHYVGGAESVRNGGASVGWMRWVISLQFGNPFWIRQEPETLSIASSETSRSLIPNLAELRITGSQVTGNFEIENSGDVESYPTWTFRGPMDSVVVSEPSGKSFSYEAAISASETITVNSKDGTVVDQLGVNKYGSLGVSPKLFTLPSGSSQVSVTATGTSAGSWTDVETLATNLVTNPSMEASSGTVTVRTNLVTNPSMESVSTGTVVMRRNLVTNPSLEVDVTGWISISPSTIVRDTTEKYVGSASLKVTTTAAVGQGAYWLSSGAILTSGITYTASTWVKGPAGHVVYALFRPGTGGDVASPDLTLTGDWQRISVTHTNASGIAQIMVRQRTAAAVVFYVDAMLLEASSTVGDYFDGSTTDALGWDYAWSGTANASISTAACAATTVRTNLITNPSFEVDTTGWGASGLTNTRVTTEFYVGTASVQAAATAIDQWSYTPLATVTASQTYTASIWLKGEAGKSFQVALFEYNSGGTISGSTNGAITTATGSWQRLSVTRTLTANAATARIYIFNKTAGAHTFYEDAAMIEAGSTVGDYFDGSFNPAGDFSYAWTGTANASTSIQRGAAVAGWTQNWLGANSQSRINSYIGSSSIAAYASASDGGIRIPSSASTTVTPSTTYTASAWVKGEAGKTFSINLEEFTSGDVYVGGTGGTVTTATGSWQRVSVSRAFGSTGARYSAYVSNKTAGAHTFYVDAVLLEASPTVQDYFDGSVVSADADLTNSWSGTAHASTSLKRGVRVAGSDGVQSTLVGTGKTLRVLSIMGGSSNDTFVDIVNMLPAIATYAGQTLTFVGKVTLTSALTGSLNGFALKFRINVGWSTGNQNITFNYTSTATNAPGTYEVRATCVIPAQAQWYNFARLYNGASAGNGDVWWDDLMVVAGTYTGDYFDGNSTTLRENGYAWTGTANASTSTWKRRELTGSSLITCNYQPRKEVVH